jgi:hypothetical protein
MPDGDEGGDERRVRKGVSHLRRSEIWGRFPSAHALG